MAGGEDMGRFWDERAREDALFFVDNRLRYGAPDEDWFWEQGRRDLEGTLARLGVAVSAEDVVVDLGCGVGRLTRALAASAAHVHAIDPSAEMLDRARDALAGAAHVTFHHGDGTTLRPIADASADACVSFVVFQHIPDPAVTLGYVREIGRVLRPGGWAAFQVSDDPGVHRPRRRGVLDRLRLRRGPRGQDHPAWLGSAVDVAALRRTAAEAGLRIERLEGEGTQYCVVLARRA